MLEIRKTDGYVTWIDGLRDQQGRARILARIGRLAAGNTGDIKTALRLARNLKE